MINQFTLTARSSLRSRLQRVIDDHRSRAELHACSPSELHRIAQDVGLTDSELRAFGLQPPRAKRADAAAPQAAGARSSLREECADGDLPGPREGVRHLQGLAAVPGGPCQRRR